MNLEVSLITPLTFHVPPDVFTVMWTPSDSLGVSTPTWDVTLVL